MKQECIPVGCVPPASWSSLWGVPGGVIPLDPEADTPLDPEANTPSHCTLGYTPLVDRILDTRLWKYYLPSTTVADGNSICTEDSQAEIRV